MIAGEELGGLIPILTNPKKEPIVSVGNACQGKRRPRRDIEICLTQVVLLVDQFGSRVERQTIFDRKLPTSVKTGTSDDCAIGELAVDPWWQLLR